jgi:uncharacterized protein (TIGR03067 family)
MRAKCLWLVAVALLAAGGTLPGGDAKQGGTAVLMQIQGTWRFTDHEMDGKPTPKDKVAKMTITFLSNKWTVREGDMVIQAGTHKFDPSKKPAEVDAIVAEGEGKGSTMLGIYELKGSTMKVCFDPKGKARPTDFTAKEGHFVAVVQREKK